MPDEVPMFDPGNIAGNVMAMSEVARVSFHSTGRPERIQVGPIKYRVTTDLSDKQYLQSRGRIGEHCIGSADSGGQFIWIDADTGSDQQKATLMHELLHVVWGMVGLHEDADLEDHEEKVVTALEAVLLDALQRNPQLLAYLCAP